MLSFRSFIESWIVFLTQRAQSKKNKVRKAFYKLCELCVNLGALCGKI